MLFLRKSEIEQNDIQLVEPFPYLFCGVTPSWSCSVFSLMTILSWMSGDGLTPIQSEEEKEKFPLKPETILDVNSIREVMLLENGDMAGTQDIAEELKYNCRTLHLPQLLDKFVENSHDISLRITDTNVGSNNSENNKRIEEEVLACSEIASKICSHFSERGGPVVIGGGMGGSGALVILGSKLYPSPEFLIHDPHCASPIDAINSLQWLPLHRAICLREAWHNILLPLPADRWDEILKVVLLDSVSPQTELKEKVDGLELNLDHEKDTILGIAKKEKDIISSSKNKDEFDQVELKGQAAHVLQETFPKVNPEWWFRTLTDLKDNKRDHDLCLVLDLPRLLKKPVCLAFARLKVGKINPTEGTLLSLAVPIHQRGRQFGKKMVCWI